MKTELKFSKNGVDYVMVAQVAKSMKLSEETIRRKLRAGMFKGAILEKGTWLIPQSYMEA